VLCCVVVVVMPSLSHLLGVCFVYARRPPENEE